MVSKSLLLNNISEIQKIKRRYGIDYHGQFMSYAFFYALDNIQIPLQVVGDFKTMMLKFYAINETTSMPWYFGRCDYSSELNSYSLYLKGKLNKYSIEGLRYFLNEKFIKQVMEENLFNEEALQFFYDMLKRDIYKINGL